MSKEIYISSTPHETRLAIVENDALTEIYYERENEYTLAGSIYNGKVTRVLPGMQSSFVDIGLDRDAFLYITDFMEEAGETADFEASSGGDSHRAPREGGGNRERGGRNDRGERGPRGDQPRSAPPVAHEPTDAELFTDAVSGIDPTRPVTDSERGERSGSRRGGRNRRDRGQNRGGNRPDAPRVETPRAETPAPDAFVAPILSAPTPDAEVGEGADGSRRWRGRRGRRGNRGAERTPDSRPEMIATPPPAVEAPARTESTGPIYDSYGPPVTDEEEFDVHASASLAPSPAIREERNDRGPRESRGDRGNRGDRGRRDAPRGPRGFAPSADLHQVEGADEATPYGMEAEVAAPMEPIILPGESLSKYRTPSEQTPVAASTVELATPAADFVVQGWDGGFVLPGETIRPRTASASSEPSHRDDRGPSRDRHDRGRNDRSDRGRGDRDRGRNEQRSDRPDRGPRPERSIDAAPVAAVIPTPEPEQHHGHFEATSIAPVEPIALLQAMSEAEPRQPPAIHAVTPLAPPPPPMPTEAEILASQAILAQQAHAASSVPVVERDFEPSEASASYRIDPVPPSEYRQAAPVVDAPVAEETHAPADPISAIPEPMPEWTEPVSEPIPAAVDHHLTSITPDGDMHSAPDAPTTHDVTEEAAPAHVEAQTETAPATEINPGDQHRPSFAPGSGVLEEEMLDDEEDAPVPVATLHGAHDDAEHETLEGAADLGSMLREMSIDHLTRSEPAVDEDDDEDDDFLEEDQDFEESEEEESEEHDEPDFVESGDSEEDESSRELDRAAFGGDPDDLDARPQTADDSSSTETREPRREPRQDRGRRDGRRGDRNRRSGSGDRDRSDSPDRSAGSSDRSAGSDRSSGSSDRSAGSDRPSGDRGRRDGRGGRQSMQSTNLPAISDLLKPGQEILCQIAKEPIAKKGARITSHIALPGRFLVFMPTVHHTGVSRKIESDGERRRLKEILLSEKGDAAGGFIVRTAASGASEEELRSDLRFLLNLWADIKTRSESSKSPALIYHDLNLVERVLRDQVTDNFSAIWVDTEVDYERILRFLQRFQPNLIRRVKLYTKETPLFEQFGITEEINKALRSKVWLKSGGSIVINQTEALVAIDINTGKFVGKTARLEDTIVKTNLDAIPEIVRQIRLRDLGGIIIIDFIDMDERKNRNKVMAALEEELKSDRAPSKVLQFNDFGLVAITRKRVKQSLERTLSTTCGVCQGTGMVKSPITVCNDIYIEMRKLHKQLDRGDIMLRVHPDVVKQLKAPATHWLQEMEEMCGKTILVKSDPSLHPEQFDLH